MVRTGDDTTTLDKISEGRVATIVSIEAGKGILSRLLGMGLVPGAKIRVLVNSGGGVIVISVYGTEISLSRGIAQKLLVKVESNEEN
ncbi:MAG: FeoA family protein [Desulfurococcaceae archaeon]|jgi:Fe2+ transport system protein FeoA